MRTANRVFLMSIAMMSASAGNQAFAQDASPNLPMCGPVPGPWKSTQTVILPSLDAQEEVEVGQSMISKHDADIHAGALRLDSPIIFEGRYTLGSFTVTVPAGTLAPRAVAGETVLLPPQWEFRYARERRARTGFGRPELQFAFDPNDPKKLIAHLNFGLPKQSYPVDFEGQSTGDCQTISLRGLRRELVYSGISQGTISIEYREFSGDYARPAFSQTLRYDLSEGRIIGFRGARFEILSANNLSVRYRVIRHLE